MEHPKKDLGGVQMSAYCSSRRECAWACEVSAEARLGKNQEGWEWPGKAVGLFPE